MNVSYHIVCENFSRAEMMVSELAYAAYNGDINVIETALQQGIEWEAEPDLLTAAIWGNQEEIFKRLVEVCPKFSDSLYSDIYYYGEHKYLEHLPPRPDIVERFSEESLLSKFKVMDLDHEEVEKMKDLFVKRPELLDDTSTTFADRVQRKPLHYACFKGSFEFIRFLVEQGSDINECDGKGRSPLTIVASNTFLMPRERKEIIQFMRTRGAEYIPEIKGFFYRWRVNQGALLFG